MQPQNDSKEHNFEANPHTHTIEINLIEKTHMRKPHKTTQKKHLLRKKSLPLWVTTKKPQNHRSPSNKS